jgi:anti-anti-sigma factor
LLWFTWDDLGTEQVIRLSSPAVDADMVARLCEALTPRKGVEIVLDLGDVQYLSSPVLSKLIDIKRKIRKAGERLRLRNVHPDLHEVFRICRLDQVFEIEA